MADESGFDQDPSGFEVFYWKEQKRYKCPLCWESGERCAFDTYDLELMGKHIREPHNRAGKIAVKKARSVSPILGVDGNRIVHEEPSKEFTGAQFKEED